MLHDTVNLNLICEKEMRGAAHSRRLAEPEIAASVVGTPSGLSFAGGLCVMDEPQQEHEQITVLIVDCEPIARNVFVKVLVRLGYQVFEAATIDEAIRICRDERQHIDALLVEFTLTDGKGTELAAEIRKHCPDVPVLLTSGTPMYIWSDVERSRFAELGIRTDFLPKPFQVSVLRSKLQRLFSIGKGG